MKITVVGLGYVGLANAILLSKDHEVIGCEVDRKKVDMINKGISPLSDPEIISYLKDEDLNLRAKVDPREDFKDSDLIILALPTNYDEESKYFDTSFIDKEISLIKSINKDVPILIKSTIPIGYTSLKNEEFNSDNIIFSPEFLREGRALYDCLNPSRIIVGDEGELGSMIADIYKKGSVNNPKTLLMKSKEAEAVKLFANTYLAMRVAFFNELDSFALVKGLDTGSIVSGVSEDPRIGNFYNNPSFGYGGYCLPKDSKQLLANFEGVPNDLFESIVRSNQTRKNFISEDILDKNPKTVGIYRLVMKKGSDNFRKSAIFDIINNLKAKDANIIIYEPNLSEDEFMGMKIVNDLKDFKKSDIILANRLEDDLVDVSERVYTRDIFNRD